MLLLLDRDTVDKYVERERESGGDRGFTREMHGRKQAGGAREEIHTRDQGRGTT